MKRSLLTLTGVILSAAVGASISCSRGPNSAPTNVELRELLNVFVEGRATVLYMYAPAETALREIQNSDKLLRHLADTAPTRESSEHHLITLATNIGFRARIQDRRGKAGEAARLERESLAVFGEAGMEMNHETFKGYYDNLEIQIRTIQHAQESVAE